MEMEVEMEFHGNPPFPENLACLLRTLNNRPSAPPELPLVLSHKVPSIPIIRLKGTPLTCTNSSLNPLHLASAERISFQTS